MGGPAGAAVPQQSLRQANGSLLRPDAGRILVAVSLTGARVTVDAGRIAFDILGLIGKDQDALRRLGGRWKTLPSVREPGGLLERWAWRAPGKADGRPVELHVLARLYRGVVWAIGVHADEYVFQLERGERGEPYLVAVERPPGTPAALVNWISKQEGEFQDVGMAE